MQPSPDRVRFLVDSCGVMEKEMRVKKNMAATMSLSAALLLPGT
jgi:predicted nucleic acid-binding Zn ribbon protein